MYDKISTTYKHLILKLKSESENEKKIYDEFKDQLNPQKKMKFQLKLNFQNKQEKKHKFHSEIDF
jgi:hypothetical protein